MQNYFQVEMDQDALKKMSVLGLAHMGDCVFELLVRSYLCLHGRETSGNLHRATVAMVAAPAQARRMERMLPLLTEQELALYRRGRNAHVHGVPKNATPGEYAKATGLECLFGALFLQGQTARINELFTLTMEDNHAV